MKKYGLIGYPLSHSFSKQFFEEKFRKEHIHDAMYDVYPIDDIEKLFDVLKAQGEICGLNITVPYKISVLPYLDWMSDHAKEIGAVNCVRVAAESPVATAFSGEVGIKGHEFMLEGFNTDFYGFENSLRPLLQSHHDKALILGDGGAARAVKYVLNKLNIEYKTVTRKPAENHITLSELTAEQVAGHTLIINTTPVGTSPTVDECPAIPYEAITSDHLLYDLIYNPEKTLFLKKGEERGAAIKNGYEMLILQAEMSWEIWNSKAHHP